MHQWNVLAFIQSKQSDSIPMSTLTHSRNLASTAPTMSWMNSLAFGSTFGCGIFLQEISQLKALYWQPFATCGSFHVIESKIIPLPHPLPIPTPTNKRNVSDGTVYVTSNMTAYADNYSSYQQMMTPNLCLIKYSFYRQKMAHFMPHQSSTTATFHKYHLTQISGSCNWKSFEQNC